MRVLGADVRVPMPMRRATRVRVSVAAEAGEGHREKSDGPYGKGDRIKIHQGA